MENKILKKVKLKKAKLYKSLVKFEDYLEKTHYKNFKKED
ncbi:MAG: hypothetical protein BAJALOKI3v1_660017 [Promethearchaeota archaeon]|nr:MAG: hypothetical protein BAJALOKI3v1_660017 [Candidatus Lokiarchaeota archaeon]